MSETVRAFERGLRVIRAFGAGGSALTLSTIARAADLNRATARRLLLTLEEEGYVRRRQDQFSLTPRVLELGYAYLSSFGVPELALPSMERLSEELQESSSIAALDNTDIVYVARVPAHRVMTVSIGLGSRFPAYRTALGRALIATWTPDEVAELWARSDRSDPTPRTVTKLELLLDELAETRRRGYALVDQELEIGVRSVAAPLHDQQGRTVAAINVSTHASRTNKSELRRVFVPALRRAASDIDQALSNRPA